ncbi:hypothetical protein QBC39DRAFT_46630 [Podospora conica]|nr:hypothetical protein QBC39DRAFT_46630 [Schizothecium conicum]
MTIEDDDRFPETNARDWDIGSIKPRDPGPTVRRDPPPGILDAVEDLRYAAKYMYKCFPSPHELNDHEKDLLFLMLEAFPFQQGVVVDVEQVVHMYLRHRDADEQLALVREQVQMMRAGTDAGRRWLRPEQRRLLVIGMEGPEEGGKPAGGEGGGGDDSDDNGGGGDDGGDLPDNDNDQDVSEDRWQNVENIMGPVPGATAPGNPIFVDETEESEELVEDEEDSGSVYSDKGEDPNTKPPPAATKKAREKKAKASANPDAVNPYGEGRNGLPGDALVTDEERPWRFKRLRCEGRPRGQPKESDLPRVDLTKWPQAQQDIIKAWDTRVVNERKDVELGNTWTLAENRLLYHLKVSVAAYNPRAVGQTMPIQQIAQVSLTCSIPSLECG